MLSLDAEAGFEVVETDDELASEELAVEETRLVPSGSEAATDLSVEADAAMELEASEEEAELIASVTLLLEADADDNSVESKLEAVDGIGI
jgi:hypothetical protein